VTQRNDGMETQMKPLMTSISLVAALCLAACNEPETAPSSAPAPAPAPSQPEPSTQLPDVSTGIPAAFQGRWASTQADCEKHSETRLEIGADSMRFYESVGAVSSVKAVGPDEIHIVVALTGEGSSSQRSFRYRLLDGGSSLFDVRNGLQRQRCG
jgi:hypothetical protein